MLPSSSLPLVSVVIPAYNHERFIEAAVESVWAQTYPHAEIIVVDDGSTDATPEIAERLSRKSPIPMTVIRKANGGVSSALNVGIGRAAGPYVSVLGSDDVFLPCKHEAMIGWLETEDGASVGACFADAYVMDEAGQRGHLLSSIWNLRGPFTLPAVLNHSASWVAPSAVYRTAVIREVGGFDETLRFEDFDFVARLLTVSAAHYIDVPVCCYRVGHGSNLSDRIEWMAEDYERVIRKMRDRGHIQGDEYDAIMWGHHYKMAGRFYDKRRLMECRDQIRLANGYQRSPKNVALYLRSLLGRGVLDALQAARNMACGERHDSG